MEANRERPYRVHRALVPRIEFAVSNHLGNLLQFSGFRWSGSRDIGPPRSVTRRGAG